MMNKSFLARARKLVLWIPVLALLFGVVLSGIIYKNLRNRELAAMTAESVQRYQDIIEQVDLLFSNSILRIQSYEDYLSSRPRSFQADVEFINQFLEYTVFQAFSVYRVLPTMDPRGTLVLKNLLRLQPEDLAVGSSDVLRKGIRHVLATNSYQMAVLHNAKEGPRISFILRSKTQKDIFFVFTTPLIRVFEKIDLRPGETMDITDVNSGFSWMVGVRGGEKTIEPNFDLASPRDPTYHRYVFNEGLPQSGLKLTFGFNFQEPVGSVSPALVTGLLSLVISLVISYLFLVLVRQNTLVTRLVLEKTHDLEKTHHDLQEALLGKNRFLGNISHEIRTPLNLILGMIDLCEERDTDKKISEYLASMRASGNHLLSMIEDLLDLAKSEANDLQVHPKKIQLVQFLDEIAKISGQDCIKKGLRFYADFSPDLPTHVVCDPSRLRQILLNLLKNACKYTNSGMICLRVYPLPNPLPGQTTCCFEVIDSGVGIPEDKLAKIFDAFFQIENSYVLSEGGVGLGLAIVKELVRKLGGRLHVESQPKKGSVFQVQLDLEAPDETSWLSSYRGSDEEKNVLLISADENLARSLLALPQHARVLSEMRVFTRIKDLWIPEASPVKNYFLVDAQIEGFSSELLKSLAAQGTVLVMGPKKSLGPALRELPVHVVDNAPVLVTEILATLGLNARAAKKMEKKEDAEVLAPSLSSEAAPEKSLSLIVADDDAGNKELYKAYFSSRPWKVEYAGDGGEAYELYLKHPADALILDVRMPVMDGFEVIEKVRAHEKENSLPARPIILVTADALENTVQRASEFDQVAFLTKPLRKAVLFQAIEKATQG